MAFDWKQLEHDDRLRDRRVLLILGVGWTAIGVVGTVVILATGHPEKLAFNIIWLVIGVVTLVLGLLARKGHGGSSRHEDRELSRSTDGGQPERGRGDG